MKKTKINFFQSPSPRHLHCDRAAMIVNHLSQYRYERSSQKQIQQVKLFNTPAKIYPIPKENSLPFLYISPFQTNWQRVENSLEENQHEMEDENSQPIQQLNFKGIQELVLYRKKQEEERLLRQMNIIQKSRPDYQLATPIKKQNLVVSEEKNQTTIKRQNFYSSIFADSLNPENEKRNVQGRLKRLAAETYLFVLNQKRTSYKQAAKQLFEYLGQGQRLNISQKNQLNIKRRVYDSLNVLIALGLLTRNGDNIFAKREQMRSITEDTNQVKQRHKRIQMADYEDSAMIKKAYQLKSAQITEKRKIRQSLKQKLIRVNTLISQNKDLREERANFQKYTAYYTAKFNFHSQHLATKTICKSKENINIQTLPNFIKKKAQLLSKAVHKTLPVLSKKIERLFFVLNLTFQAFGSLIKAKQVATRLQKTDSQVDNNEAN